MQNSYDDKSGGKSRKRVRENNTEGELNMKGENEINAPYRDIVRSLLYLMGATRSDINYAMNIKWLNA